MEYADHKDSLYYRSRKSVAKQILEEEAPKIQKAHCKCKENCALDEVLDKVAERLVKALCP